MLVLLFGDFIDLVERCHQTSYQRGTQSLMFHFIQTRNGTTSGRGHFVDFSFWMGVGFNQQTGGSHGGLHGHF